MTFIEKELLIGRVQYLEKINSKPGIQPVNEDIIKKVIELINSDELITFMQVEAVFNYLVENANSSPEKIQDSATEILDFIS